MSLSKEITAVFVANIGIAFAALIAGAAVILL